MGKEAMVAIVTQPLTPDMIEAGRLLIESISEKSGLEVTAALWLLDSEARAWTLMLGSRSVDATGPRQAYRALHAAWLHGGLDRLPVRFDAVTIVSSKDPRLQLSARALKMPPGSSGTRFSGSTVGGTFIEDAYVYRMAAG